MDYCKTIHMFIIRVLKYYWYKILRGDVFIMELLWFFDGVPRQWIFCCQPSMARSEMSPWKCRIST